MFLWLNQLLCMFVYICVCDMVCSCIVFVLMNDCVYVAFAYVWLFVSNFLWFICFCLFVFVCFLESSMLFIFLSNNVIENLCISVCMSECFSVGVFVTFLEILEMFECLYFYVYFFVSEIVKICDYYFFLHVICYYTFYFSFYIYIALRICLCGF